MARIPRNIGRRITPSGRVGDVPIPFDIADTGEGIEARGLSALGVGAFRLGESLFRIQQQRRRSDIIAAQNLDKALLKIKKAEGISQAATARNRTLTELRALELNLSTNNEPETYSAEFDKTIETINQFRPQNPIGAESFDNWIRENITGWEFDVVKLANKKGLDLIEGAYISNRAAAITRGDVDEALRLTAEAKDSGAITIQKAAKDLQETPGLIMESQVRKSLNQASRLYSENEFGRATTEIAKAEGILNIADLDPTTEGVLRSRINTSKKAIETKAEQSQKDLVDETTSRTIGEYFQGTLTETELFSRHESGLIKDGEFKFMIQGLRETAPDVSDPFAAGRIRRAITDFGGGVISRQEAETVLLENYTKLSTSDRPDVFESLESTTSKIIETAKKNAYDEGKGLMSRRFVGIQSEEELIDIIRGSGLSEEEKRKINKRFTLEVNNRDLYERAVDDRVVELRKQKGVALSAQEVRKETIQILLNYQRRARLGLEELEREVEAEQQRIIEAVIVPAEELSPEAAQRELERVRKRKRQLSGTGIVR